MWLLVTSGRRNKRCFSSFNQIFSFLMCTGACVQHGCINTDAAETKFHVIFFSGFQTLILLVATTLTSCSTLFPKPIISYANAALYWLQSVFIFLKDDSLQPADWQQCVYASLSPSQNLSVAIACGRPQSHGIRSDFGFHGASCWCLLKVCLTFYSTDWLKTDVALQMCKVVILGASKFHKRVILSSLKQRSNRPQTEWIRT